MKNFILGFFVCLSLCLSLYIGWEGYRHVPIFIKKIKVPVPVPIQAPQRQINPPLVAPAPLLLPPPEEVKDFVLKTRYRQTQG